MKKSEGDTNHERLLTLGNKLRVAGGEVGGQGKWVMVIKEAHDVKSTWLFHDFIILITPLTGNLAFMIFTYLFLFQQVEYVRTTIERSLIHLLLLHCDVLRTETLSDWSWCLWVGLTYN